MDNIQNEFRILWPLGVKMSQYNEQKDNLHQNVHKRTGC